MPNIPHCCPPVGVWTVSQFQCGRSPSQVGYRSSPWWAVTLTNQLIGRELTPYRIAPFTPSPCGIVVLCGISRCFHLLSPCMGQIVHRVTHPSAAEMFSVQALRTSPLDLHVLSTPPAFVLSQDQTLMFDLSQEALPPRTTRQSRPQRPSSCCLLSQNLTVLVASIFHLSMKNARFSSFSVSFSRFARRPPGLLRGLPHRRSFQAAYAIISAFTPVVNPLFFNPQTTISSPLHPLNPQYIAVLGPFCLAFASNFGLLRV